MFSFGLPPTLLITAPAEILRRFSSSLLRSLQPSQGVDDIIRIKPVSVIKIEPRRQLACPIRSHATTCQPVSSERLGDLRAGRSEFTSSWLLHNSISGGEDQFEFPDTGRFRNVRCLEAGHPWLRLVP